MKKIFLVLLSILFIPQVVLGSTVTVGPANSCGAGRDTACDYSSLNGALSGETTNLVTGTDLLTIECYEFSDTTAATTGTGYTTDSSYYIYIKPAAGAGHSGVFDTNKYYHNLSTQWVNSLTISEPYTRVEGLQFTGTINSQGIAASSSDLQVYNSIFKSFTTSFRSGLVISSLFMNFLSPVSYSTSTHASKWSIRSSMFSLSFFSASKSSYDIIILASSNIIISPFLDS